MNGVIPTTKSHCMCLWPLRNVIETESPAVSEWSG